MHPRITLSAPRSLFVSRERVFRIAEETGADGVDLDSRRRLGRIDSSLVRRSGASAVPIATVSLTAADLPLLASGALNAQIESVQSECLVVTLPAVGDARTDHAAAVAASTPRMRATCIVMSIPAAENGDGRAHLARIRNLMRLAEEWNFAIGIELDRRADSRWEAEAAVHIAAEKLSFVRLSSVASGADETPSDLANRTLRACRDIDFRGIVSVCPDLAPWHALWPGSVAAAFVRHRELIRRAFIGRELPLQIAHDRSVRQRN